MIAAAEQHASTSSAGTDEPAHEGIRETIDSIVVAFILAFVFRAFVIEAFIIPTGSMAPTLYGAHGTITCADCGTEFAYGLRDLKAGLQGQRPRHGGSPSNPKARCPNCNHVNVDLKYTNARRNAESGDRILVFKWPFDFGGEGLDPRRWDVTVFKDPSDGTTNFIKRLVGLPNEVLMLLDGDLYVAPVEALDEAEVSAFKQQQRAKFEQRMAGRRGRLQPLPERILQSLDDKLQIARKTDAAQQALWSPVYDHDYPPQTRDANQPWWRRGKGETSGWNTEHRTVRFEARGTPADYIELGGKKIVASCAYNTSKSIPDPPVSDLRVRFVLTPESQDGLLRVRLTKQGVSFWATIQMDGAVSICESDGEPTAETPPWLTTRVSPFQPGKPVQVAFENLDYRLALSIAGQEVLATSTNRSDDTYYGPHIAALRKMRSPPSGRTPRNYKTVPPRIYAANGDLSLVHLVVERDVYYYDNLKLSARPWTDIRGWGTAGAPILLRDDEYFMLGDNSAASKDSRLWDNWGSHLIDRGDRFQIGTVPRDQLIGKAFFVYWPMGHRIEWLPMAFLRRIGIIPDIGRMRWIR